MALTSLELKTSLEIIAPDKSRQHVNVTQSPFFIGRGGEGDNHLQLADGRISRKCAALIAEEGAFHLEDRGNRYGVFVNGSKVERRGLHDGDVITFGVDGCYEIVFHVRDMQSQPTNSGVEDILRRIGSLSDFGGTGAGGLNKLNLLLEATSLLHSQLPLESVLGTMLDHAIFITQADRGLLIESDATGALRTRLARSNQGEDLAPESLNPSQTVVNRAIRSQSSVITEDLNLAGLDLKGAESIVVQGLMAIVAIPLYSSSRGVSETGTRLKSGELLGVIYLDSRSIAAFTAIDRQILDALAMESASILDNARLMERERERQRLEQELSTARNIQQALLPRGLNDFPHLAISGVQYSCHEVGGDYFDVFPITEDRTAVLIADASGKGLGAALFTTMLQGTLSGMTVGADPVKVFNHINTFLCRHAEMGRCATIFIGLIDRDGELEYIKAGHPSPLLLRNGKVSELYSEGSLPLGLIPAAKYASARLQLEPNDTLVLFSDGVTEAQDPDRRLFEFSGISQALSGQDGKPVEAVQQTILDAVSKFTRGEPQSDDLTLLVVRYRVPE
jgi:phosphoserine phosphatase RsbU/P